MGMLIFGLILMNPIPPNEPFKVIAEARIRAALIAQLVYQRPDIKLKDLQYLNRDELCSLLVAKKIKTIF